MVVGGVAVGAAVRTFPFRVYSFPTDIKIASANEFPAWMYSAANYLRDFPVMRDNGYWELVKKFREDIQHVAVIGPGLFGDAELAQTNWV